MSTIPKAAFAGATTLLVTALALSAAGMPMGLLVLGIRGSKEVFKSVASDRVKAIAQSELEAKAKKKAAAQIGFPQNGGQPNIGQEVDSVA